jgi:putative membrane protein
MARDILSDPEKAALLAAVKDVERRSAAEVVVAFRGRSGTYLDADLIAGVLLALFTLWFQLFSPWEFNLPVILVSPILAGAAGAFLSSRAPNVRRLLTSRASRRERVRVAALAAFHEMGVGETRERTGVLVYVSCLERMASVVPDSGVRRRVAGGAWDDGARAVETAALRGAPGAAVAESIRALGDILARALPPRADDVNELADEVTR